MGFVVYIGLAAFALLVAWLHHGSPRHDGVVSAMIENEDLVMLDRPRRVPTEVLRRLARGTMSPLASTVPARARIGELQTRRLGTPMPSHDDGWD